MDHPLPRLLLQAIERLSGGGMLRGYMHQRFNFNNGNWKIEPKRKRPQKVPALSEALFYPIPCRRTGTLGYLPWHPRHGRCQECSAKKMKGKRERLHLKIRSPGKVEGVCVCGGGIPDDIIRLHDGHVAGRDMELSFSLGHGGGWQGDNFQSGGYIYLFEFTEIHQ